jgi:hypothetical protein
MPRARAVCAFRQAPTPRTWEPNPAHCPCLRGEFSGGVDDRPPPMAFSARPLTRLRSPPAFSAARLPRPTTTFRIFGRPTPTLAVVRRNLGETTPTRDLAPRVFGSPTPAPDHARRSCGNHAAEAARAKLRPVRLGGETNRRRCRERRFWGSSPHGAGGTRRHGSAASAASAVHSPTTNRTGRKFATLRPSLATH